MRVSLVVGRVGSEMTTGAAACEVACDSPVHKATGRERSKAALAAHRPPTPVPFKGRVRRPHEHVHAWAAKLLGDSVGRAFAGIFRPDSKIDRGLARRVADAMLPKERPVPLAVPDINGPVSQDRATALVYNAVRTGTITPREALIWFEIIDRRYQSWIKEYGARPLFGR